MAEKIGKASKGWWIYLVVGILAALVGIAFLGNLALAITTITIIAGVYFLISGIGGVITTIADRKYISLWGLKLALHILVILAGFALLTRPVFALSFLWVICGIGFLFDGISMIVMSVGLKKIADGAGWVVMLIFGILIILASLAIMGNPILGLTVMALCAAFGAIFFGINNIIYAFQVKKLS